MSGAKVKQAMVAAAIIFRLYQEPVFVNRKDGIEILFWSRQIGKSFTLACWIVDRMITRPGRLITVLSNSRDNGAELNMKIAEICSMLGELVEQEDNSPDLRYENMNFESRIVVNGKISRVKVLAANPRTARGFSGDLILDEFAFHEDGQRIWEAAEPILASNPDYLCRIASTPNGKKNMFYRMVTSGLYPVNKVRRSDAHEMGLKIYHPNTRQPITPEEARSLAIDKKAYDQNYELIWADENTTLLTYALISLAEQEDVGVICEQDWSEEAVELIRRIPANLYVGVDVGRSKDITVITVLEKAGHTLFVRALLRLDSMRLPDQQKRLNLPLSQKAFRKCYIDMTGIGLGLTEYAQDYFGVTKITGIHFSSSVPATAAIKSAGVKATTVKVTEAMATELLQTYEDQAIKHPYDERLRDDLRQPEKVVTSSGQVSIAASSGRDHADHFWSIALALYAAKRGAFGEVQSRNVGQEYQQTIRSRWLNRRRKTTHRKQGIFG